MTRKEFLGGAAAFAAIKPSFATKPSEIRAVLLHMGMNMWGEWRAPGEPKVEGKRYTREEIHFSEDIWKRTIDHAKKRGFNMVVMDLGEFLAYPSHPELAVKGSWSADRMRAEVRRLKSLGLEPIPKLRLFADLDKAGFDQVPCPSNWLSSKLKASGRTDNDDCAAEVVKYCRANIAPERLKGFMMASWTDCQGEWAFKFNCAGMDQLAVAVERNSGL